MRVVRAKLRNLGKGRVKAMCVWKIPKGVVGARLEASVVVAGSKRDSARIAFAGRVRRA